MWTRCWPRTSTIGHNPRVKGLTGLETWLWLDGYDGSEIITPVTGLGITVEVQLTHATTFWDFGDNLGYVETVTTGADHEGSEARHTYFYKSTDLAGGTYTLVADTTLNAAYRIGTTGPFTPLEPITLTTTTPYVVQEYEAVLTTNVQR